MLHRRFALLVFLFAVPLLHADVTVRYTMEVKLSMPMPAGADAAIPAMLQVVRVKGDKAYCEAGNVVSIIDFTRQEMTVLDTGSKRFATMSIEQYKQAVTSMVQGALKNMPPDAGKAFESLKTNVEVNKNAGTDVIQGIQAVERQAVMTISAPMPGDEHGANSAFTMKMVMQVWNAKPEEALRVPAVRETGVFNLVADYLLNTSSSVKDLLQMIPGFDKTFGSAFEEISANKSMLLRMRMSMYMPMLAGMSQGMGEEGRPAPNTNPDAPFGQFSLELKDLSTAPIDDSVFRVPTGYQAAPFEELMKTVMPVPQMPAVNGSSVKPDKQ